MLTLPFSLLETLFGRVETRKMSRAALVLTFALALAAIVSADHYVYTIKQESYTTNDECSGTPDQTVSNANGTCYMLLTGTASSNASCNDAGRVGGWTCAGSTPSCLDNGSGCAAFVSNQFQTWGQTQCVQGMGTSLGVTCIRTLTADTPTTPEYVF